MQVPTMNLRQRHENLGEGTKEVDLEGIEVEGKAGDRNSEDPSAEGQKEGQKDPKQEAA